MNVIAMNDPYAFKLQRFLYQKVFSKETTSVEHQFSCLPIKIKTHEILQQKSNLLAIWIQYQRLK